MKNDETFIEIEVSQFTKTGEDACGDDFKIHKDEEENRQVAVISDGLGSGIKAALLANMTTTMALEFVGRNMEILQSAEIMMDALPVCEVRKISYATFTIIDAMPGGRVRIVEMDNPSFIHLRNGKDLQYEKQVLYSDNWPDRKLHITELKAVPEDRIIFFTDGVTQAGLGQPEHKFGWRRSGCLEFVQSAVSKKPDISALELSQMVVSRARYYNPGFKCLDDITCGVMYFRRPRQMMLFTGPPFKPESDCELAGIFRDFSGNKIICGGTTATIIGRELNREIITDLKIRNGGLPPVSKMKGADMVSEGILTLTETAKYLECDEPYETAPAVKKMVEMFRGNDIINFVVGTKVNEAHQDPSLPVDLEIRRNIIRRIGNCLEHKFRKQVNIRYI